jgi:hypothetical protein
MPFDTNPRDDEPAEKEAYELAMRDGCDKRTIAQDDSFDPMRTVVHPCLNRRWARNVVNGNPHKSGSFVFGIAGAYLLADDSNEGILNEAITRLREKYPTWDIQEKGDA